MNILFVITGLGLGGAELQLLELSKKMHQAGHHIKIVVLRNLLELKPRFEAENIPVEVLNLQGIHNLPSAIRRFAGIIKAFGPHVVHSHMVHANLFTRVARFFCHIPRLINTAHSNNEGGKMRMLGYRLTDSLSDLTTNVGKSGAQRFVALKAVPQKKMMYVPNGIDEEKYRKDIHKRVTLRREMGLENCFVFICVARLSSEKGQQILLPAFKLLLDADNNPYKLLLVGKGPQEPELKAAAFKLGIHEHTVFLGSRQDVPDLLSAADCFVLPSLWEGFGLALAEAVACELPAIATRSGGPEEILANNVGTLVRPGNVNELFEAMKEVAARQTHGTDKIAEDNRSKIISDYSINKIRDKWLALYKQ